MNFEQVVVLIGTNKDGRVLLRANGEHENLGLEPKKLKLAEWQRMVGGYVQLVDVERPTRKLQLVCNEDGWALGLAPNLSASYFHRTTIVGDVVLCWGRGKFS